MNIVTSCYQCPALAVKTHNWPINLKQSSVLASVYASLHVCSDGKIKVTTLLI